MELHNIQLNEIATPSLVRRQNGQDKTTLSELAASMQDRGLISPILLRKAQAEDETPLPFVVVAGRRRIAAAKMLGWTTIPALLDDMDAMQAYLSEAAENLHREDMTLADVAQFVRTLMMTYDDQKAVAKFVGKSPAWVSKHLSVTSGKCPIELKALMENGAVTDLETLLLLKQIAELSPAKFPGAPAAFHRMLKVADDGNMSRALARDTLARLKEPTTTVTNSTTGVQRLTTSRTVETAPNDDPNEPRTDFKVTLPIELLGIVESKGGAEALAMLIRAHSESEWLPKEEA
jgi:ParB/RepB/Spo0J family partition protein